MHLQQQSLPHQAHSQLGQHISIHIQDDKAQSMIPIGPEDLHPQIMAGVSHPGLNGHSVHHSMSHNGLEGFELPLDPQAAAPHPGFDSPYANLSAHMIPHPHQPHPNVLPAYADQQQVRHSS